MSAPLCNLSYFGSHGNSSRLISLIHKAGIQGFALTALKMFIYSEFLTRVRVLLLNRWEGSGWFENEHQMELRAGEKMLSTNHGEGL